FLRGWVDRGASRIAFQAYAVAGDTLRAGDRRIGRGCLAEQDRLRQRRPLIGLARFLGNERDGGLRVAALGFDRGENARRAAADNNDIPGYGHVQARSAMSISSI